MYKTLTGSCASETEQWRIQRRPFSRPRCGPTQTRSRGPRGEGLTASGRYPAQTATESNELY